jgi:hypothetical protein
MARITRTELDAMTEAAAIATKWELWLQKSDTGYQLLKRRDAGAEPIGECLTAAETKQLLRGLFIGANV